MAGKVAAVHRRDIERRQRRARLRVVPVVEMALVPLELRHRVERIGRTQDELARRNVAEVVGGEIREQREAHVRRRRAMRDDRDRMLLIVVGRQPPVVRTDERLEERPGPSRERAQEGHLPGGQSRFAPRERAAHPPCDAGRDEPQQEDRRRHGQCRRNRCRQQDRRRGGDHRGDPHRLDGGDDPLTPAGIAGTATIGVHAREGRPFQQFPAADEHPPRGARDRIDIDRRLVGKEGERQQCLRGAAAGDDRRVGEMLQGQHLVRRPAQIQHERAGRREHEHGDHCRRPQPWMRQQRPSGEEKENERGEGRGSAADCRRASTARTWRADF